MKVAHFRERYWDPASAAPPPPLEALDDEVPEQPTMEQLRMQGGPSLDDLRTALVEALHTGDSDTIGDLFHALPDDLRRPVEILGLLHLASRVDALDEVSGEEIFEAIRPDGERRTFLVPAVPISLDATPAIARLADLDDHGDIRRDADLEVEGTTHE